MGLHSIRLASLDHAILRSLGRVEFATRAQLAHWCGVDPATASKATGRLRELGLMWANDHVRPVIWHLSHAGAETINIRAPTEGRRISWSVMAHACHRNALEIELGRRHGGFRFLSRQSLLKQGLNPVHGEHAGVDETSKSWFVLLDDYLMTSRRIASSWNRRHVPTRKYWPEATGRAWCEIVQHYIVCCTDRAHAETHRRWIAAHDIPADLTVIAPLWPQ